MQPYYIVGTEVLITSWPTVAHVGTFGVKEHHFSALSVMHDGRGWYTWWSISRDKGVRIEVATISCSVVVQRAGTM